MGWGATRPPIGWSVGPTMVLICIVDMVFQIALSAIKVHMLVKQHVLIVSMLPLINGIEPQVKAGEMVIHVLIKMRSIKTQGARLCAAPSHGEVYLSSLGDTEPELPGTLEPAIRPAPPPPTLPPSPPKSPP